MIYKITDDPDRFGSWVEVRESEENTGFALRSFELYAPAENRELRVAKAMARCAVSVSVYMARAKKASR
jgi:hypothetical protein